MYSKKLGLTTLVVAVVVAVCGLVLVSASAAEIRVPEDYASIQEAVNAASAGDTIIVGPGTYGEDPIMIDGKSNITIRSSAGAELTTIRGTIIIRDSSGITIEGFTISSPTGDGIYFETTDPEVPLSGIVIKDNRIVNCTGSGINFENSHYSDVLIEGNTISENGFDGIRLLGTGNDVTIRDNEITDNGVLIIDELQRVVGAGGAGGMRGCGIRMSRTLTNVIIEDNVITGNAFADIHPQ